MITLSGTIGAGKTSWGEVIADHFGVNLLEEKVQGNPFLSKYYENPELYSFHLQVFFLNHRFKAIKEALQHPNTVLDRSIYEDAMIFASLQYENGSMDKDTYETYLDLHENMMQELHDLYEQQALLQKSPDLLVHVHGSFEEVQRRVRKRGREFEQTDNNPELLQYYLDLHEKYETFPEEYTKQEISPVFEIDIDKYDINNPEHRDEILKGVEETLRESRGYAFPEEKDVELFAMNYTKGNV
ncbi:deoxynucleoside kinase [Halobacillus karajensis]|uniref:deoxynucleoside kinase n=1 Tax=Halobacillus karajensis TaxID=195088 RepID=UPI00068D27B2|nr:deoxynucleoside kinase [Halobacillus karajensis]